MVDLKLKRVSIRNWMKFRSVQLDFPEKGLVLVQGINSASGGALQSVGSGKTGIGEAISRALLGVSGRFDSLKQCSTDKKGNTYIKLEAVLHGKPLKVELGYKCAELSATGEALRYTYDGVKTERGLIDQTRVDLTRLIGVPPLLAAWTAFVDGDNLKFHKLKQAESVELVMSSLRQPPWTEYHATSTKALGKFNREAAQNAAARQNAILAASDAAENLKRAKAALDREKSDYDTAARLNERALADYKKAADSSQDRITKNRDEMSGIKKKLKLMEDQRASESHALEITLSEIDDQRREAEAAAKPLKDERYASVAARTKVENAHSDYVSSGALCPTCNQPRGALDSARVKKLKDALLDAQEREMLALRKSEKSDKKVADLHDKYRKMSAQHRQASAKSDVENMSDRYEELEIQVGQLLDKIHGYELKMASIKNGPSDAALKTAQARALDRKSEADRAAEALKLASDTVDADQSTLKVLEYWNLAFSPYGVPNMILKSAIPPLNNEARRVSATMTGGTIEIRFNTIRELASGMEKAQLTIEVDNKLGDSDFHGSSKGESGLTNAIIAETLSEVGQVSRRVGFRWYDEVLPNQDPKVCQSFYAYMKHTAQQLGILVFLVDHNPAAANYADHTLIVEKTSVDGVIASTARWA